MAVETANPVLGVALHAIGGLAAASFYIPYKRVKGWSWESYWLVQGVLSWIIAPLVGALLTIPDLWGVLSRSPSNSLFLAYLFGALWGIGGLTFGLSMRFLGVSLGYALALGFTMAFGTLVPPIVGGGMPELLGTASGLATLGGVAVAIAGVAVCCYAGSLKEKELSAQDKAAAIREFVFTKGVGVAIFAGIMSACMAFALQAGQPIGDEAVKAGANSLFQTNAILVVVLLGGFTTNFLWCVSLNIRNKSGKDYSSGALNYALASLGGLLWYLQFFFYGMGTTRLGPYNFASWTIHMAFIIVFSTLWGLSLGEWAKCSRKTVTAVTAGILVLVLSTVVIGYGNYRSSEEKKEQEVTAMRLGSPALKLAASIHGQQVPNDPSRVILDEVKDRIERAQTLSVTEVRFAEEFPRRFKTRWWYRKGGHYRSESEQGTLICGPTKSWSYKPTGKEYRIFPGAQKDWSLSKAIGLGEFGDPAQMPTIGEPKQVQWHGHAALRIEVDGTRTMTKETKLFFFFDPKTHDQIGVSANLGSVTQVRLYSDLKVDPKIDDSMFRFVPPKGWKLVKR